MDCYVYKGALKPDCYLYVATEGTFDAVPAALLDQLGELQFVLQFALHPERTLAQEDARSVIDSLTERGFHLQMPPPPDQPPDQQPH
ncbi:MAG: YcgL domain-containing protein [Pseudomonadota bacterium]